MSVPFVTVIIPTRPGDEAPLALACACELDHPRDRLEIIVVRGTQPSVQRNTALRAAKGDWIYFLDDDSGPLPGNLKFADSHFHDEKVQMVGGPNLCPPEVPVIEQAFAAVMASWLAFGPSRARYAKVGEARPASEKELILCNLLARRITLLELGGFDEALYPNEENALMDAIQHRGGLLIYDPKVQVYRRPRHTLGAFVKMLLNYGRGRAEQFRLHPSLGSVPNFVPPLFCLYLTSLPLVPAVLWWPLGLYALAVVVQTARTCTAGLEEAALGTVSPAHVAPLIVLSHIFYGLGFWKGLFTRPQPKPPDQVGVTLETISLA